MAGVARPQPTHLYHFTHIDHIADIVDKGLLSDTIAQNLGVITKEIGNQEIKDKRRQSVVGAGPRGVVSDYVPFYFAPNSPMMYVISCGSVPTYQEGTSPLVYLVVDLDEVLTQGFDVVTTDRNAVLKYAQFFEGLDGLDDHIDWELMKATFWNNTRDEHDRKERRMAECLIHELLPFSLVKEFHVRTEHWRSQLIKKLGVEYSEMIHVTPLWYF